MKHAKKMKLVDINYSPEPVKENAHNISTQNPGTSHEDKTNDALSFLDRHMKAILESTNLTDFDKWSQYNQALTRYLHWFKERNSEKTVELNLRKIIDVLKTNDDTVENGSVVESDSDDSTGYVNVNKKRTKKTIDTPRKRVKSEITRKQNALKRKRSKLLFKNWLSNISA